MAKSDVVKQIKKATCRKFSAEEKIRIVLEGLRGEISISELCRREGAKEATFREAIFLQTFSKAADLTISISSKYCRQNWAAVVTGQGIWANKEFKNR